MNEQNNLKWLEMEKMEEQNNNVISRLKNPIFYFNLLMAIGVPILAYFGLSGKDLTSWNTVFHLLLESIKNPYVLGLVVVSVWNTCINPTTKGIRD